MYRDYDEERDDDELYHHGRKGQKWGQHIYSMASVLAYAGSRAIQSRRRKKNLESVRNNFGNVEGAYD